MGVMAVRLFITILLLFHQISPSIQQSDQLDQFTSPIDRDEIRDRRTLNCKKDCPDTVLLRSCQRNLNETQQELVETRGNILELQTEIARERNETKDKDVEMSRLTAKMAQIEANLMEKITETKRKNDDLEAQLNRTMNLLKLDGWSYLAKTASSYKFIARPMTFDEAEEYCASQKDHLVSIHSQEENDFVQKLAKNVTSSLVFWIGMKRNPNKENAFEWTDGSSVDFTNWKVGEPDSNTHAYLWSNTGTWEAYSPTKQYRFICKRSSQF
ncbi:unnamed protein product, partial [Mesorhabditis belari]|uniref:C-type lectin domain-containing protein n=1 Tax=Mesorhabditis belari TaxID=2138241 RepID=A0AAF3F7G9_9BILA